MPARPDQPVTELLRAAQAGDADAAERLLAVVYEQLRQLARARLGHLPPGHTLQPTALVHEAYLRLTDKSDVTWESRQHFYFAAARAMRDILVEQARRKARPVRGGGRRRQELDEACAVIEPPAENVLAVHEALEELEKQDPLEGQDRAAALLQRTDDDRDGGNPRPGGAHAGPAVVFHPGLAAEAARLSPFWREKV
jgi:RNA polymerase sigma factor (TIGR02999 family)